MLNEPVSFPDILKECQSHSKYDWCMVCGTPVMFCRYTKGERCMEKPRVMAVCHHCWTRFPFDLCLSYSGNPRLEASVNYRFRRDQFLAKVRGTWAPREISYGGAKHIQGVTCIKCKKKNVHTVLIEPHVDITLWQRPFLLAYCPECAGHGRLTGARKKYDCPFTVPVGFGKEENIMSFGDYFANREFSLKHYG